jgi:hypothetical protein
METVLLNNLLNSVLLQHHIYSIHIKGTMEPLATQIQYAKYSWHVYRDFKALFLA